MPSAGRTLNSVRRAVLFLEEYGGSLNIEGAADATILPRIGCAKPVMECGCLIGLYFMEGMG
jgi:hypothetical protein